MRSLARLMLPALLATLAAGCVDDLGDDVPEGEDGLGDHDDGAGDDAKADGTGEVRARIEGLTVWMDPAAYRVASGAWIVEGRASRNLAEVFSFVPDDAFAEAAITGKRTFTLTFRDGHELNTMLSGLPLFVKVTPVTGAPATAAVWLQPELARISGSTKINLHSAIEPVWVGGELAYRGVATTTNGWAGLAVTVSGGVAPTVRARTARTSELDWAFDGLLASADASSDRVRVTASRQGVVVEKTAAIDFAVQRLALTRRDPYEVWQRDCDDDVRACLIALPDGAVDAGDCGSYREVQACGGIEHAGPPAAAQLVTDFRDYLVYWYGEHGADVVASGGNDLAAAQAAVDAAGFELVTDPAEDPSGHDLTQTWVLRHRDVTFPGSDRVWFVAYEKVSGGFLEAYVFE